MAEKLTRTGKMLRHHVEIASDGRNFSKYEQELRISRLVIPADFMAAVMVKRAAGAYISEATELKAALALNISKTNYGAAKQRMVNMLGEDLVSIEPVMRLTPEAAEEVREHDPLQCAIVGSFVMACAEETQRADLVVAA